jgi:hypothetical protein
LNTPNAILDVSHQIFLQPNLKFIQKPSSFFFNSPILLNSSSQLAQNYLQKPRKISILLRLIITHQNFPCCPFFHSNNYTLAFINNSMAFHPHHCFETHFMLNIVEALCKLRSTPFTNDISSIDLPFPSRFIPSTTLENWLVIESKHEIRELGPAIDAQN